MRQRRVRSRLLAATVSQELELQPGRGGEPVGAAFPFSLGGGGAVHAALLVRCPPARLLPQEPWPVGPPPLGGGLDAGSGVSVLEYGRGTADKIATWTWCKSTVGPFSLLPSPFPRLTAPARLGSGPGAGMDPGPRRGIQWKGSGRDRHCDTMSHMAGCFAVSVSDLVLEERKRTSLPSSLFFLPLPHLLLFSLLQHFACRGWDVAAPTHEAATRRLMSSRRRGVCVCVCVCICWLGSGR
ncbi:hypothetical protein QBC39DRAFT_185404 [Podospora conica]|nr:hypothetical protein QBC39DRAFT_185404 [Schizothecium conicum]